MNKEVKLKGSVLQGELCLIEANILNPLLPKGLKVELFFTDPINAPEPTRNPIQLDTKGYSDTHSFTQLSFESNPAGCEYNVSIMLLNDLEIIHREEQTLIIKPS